MGDFVQLFDYERGFEEAQDPAWPDNGRSARLQASSSACILTSYMTSHIIELENIGGG
jgi:hypothetical protein